MPLHHDQLLLQKHHQQDEDDDHDQAEDARGPAVVHRPCSSAWCAANSMATSTPSLPRTTCSPRPSTRACCTSRTATLLSCLTGCARGTRRASASSRPSCSAG